MAEVSSGHPSCATPQEPTIYIATQPILVKCMFMIWIYADNLFLWILTVLSGI